MSVIYWFNVSYFFTVSNYQGVHLLQVKKMAQKENGRQVKKKKRKIHPR